MEYFIKDRNKLPYRSCVGIAVFNNLGKVWVGKKSCKNKKRTFESSWEFPQGGIKKGEKPLCAAIRELKEETGIHSIKLIVEIEDWLKYDFPSFLSHAKMYKKYRGQIQKWFIFKFTGKQNEINLNLSFNGTIAEFDDWNWYNIEEIPKITVSFKKKIYEQLIIKLRYLNII